MATPDKIAPEIAVTDGHTADEWENDLTDVERTYTLYKQNLVILKFIDNAMTVAAKMGQHPMFAAMIGQIKG